MNNATFTNSSHINFSIVCNDLDAKLRETLAYPTLNEFGNDFEVCDDDEELPDLGDNIEDTNPYFFDH